MSPIEIERLLDALCVDMGFCLPPKAKEELVRTPPDEPTAFARAVFIAENLNPDSADRHLFRQVRDRIADAMRRSADHAEPELKE